jgi:DNA-binding NarL/FixJ family response regulator
VSIRVAIVEDNSAVRENLAVLIDAAPGFSCVGSCATAEEAWRRLPSIGPDVVLMDLHLPGENGISCVARLKGILAHTQVIMLTVEEDSQQVFESLKAGATGYLVKNVEPARILEAVKEVHNGGAPMSSQIAREVVSAFRQKPAGLEEALSLSRREEAVLALLAKGYRTKEIADELGVGVATVNTYVRNIYDKLHVRSRAEAVARYSRRT